MNSTSSSNAKCQCGCGETAPIARHTDSRQGWTKGEPLRFLLGHNNRLRRVDPADALSALKQWSNAHGGACPSISVWKRARPVGTPGPSTIILLFGSWRAACAKAGLDARSQGQKDGVDWQRGNIGLRARNRQMVSGGDLGAKRRGPGGGYA